MSQLRTSSHSSGHFDLLGRSWAMGIVWNRARGPLNFRELQRRCEMASPTTVNKRIKELREALLVEQTAAGYALTASGRELYEQMTPLARWSKEWAAQLGADAKRRPRDNIMNERG